MKKTVRTVALILLCFFVTFLSACREAETDLSDNANVLDKEVAAEKYKNIDAPEIPSDDTVMTPFLDISFYNVENYSEIYLGDDFKVDALFDNTKISLPATYSEMAKKGFSFIETSDFNENSLLYAGDKQTAYLVNKNGFVLSAVFYNNSNESKKASKCDIVKFELANDAEQIPNFRINGISSASSLSEAITFLGYPSHFHDEGNGIYLLDYFFSKKDLRNRISLHVNPAEDTVVSISLTRFNTKSK